MVQRGTLAAFHKSGYDLGKVPSVRKNDVGDPIFRKGKPRFPRRGFSGYENGDDRTSMAFFVEVFQIERIIRHLVYRIPVEPRRSDLEFEDKNHSAKKENAVRPFSHAGNGILKCKGSGLELGKPIFKKPYLCDPGVPLHIFESKSMGLRKFSKYAILVIFQELMNLRGIVRARH